MLKIAIVGNIASGKSTVEKILQNKNYFVVDTDEIAHDILKNNKIVEEIFKTTDRKELAKIVFNDSIKLKQLESIIHPLVKKELEYIFSQEYRVVFVSVPQLFESGLESMFDKIIYITALEEIRKDRLIKRNNITPEEAQKRIDAQSDIGKREKSDFIIENNYDISYLQDSVSKILESIFV